MPKALLEECQKRADALGMNRSAYIVQLLRRDLAQRADLVIAEEADHEAVNSATSDIVEEALARKARKKRKPGS
jgi:metal-responsive CopG/Arc/MetJ family transcriptional regulator